MEHDLHLPGETAQVLKKGANMLRGYDPLREIYQWKLLSLLFFSELILVGLASLPMYNSAWLLAEGAVWGIHPGAFVPFLLLLGTIPFLLVYNHYRKERRARVKLRHEALVLHAVDQASAQLQPSPAFQKILLPVQVECRRKRAFTNRVLLEILLLVASLVGSYLIVLVNPSEPRFLYAAVPGLLSVMIIGFSVGIWLEMRLPIAGRYLLPSLAIDDEAITAHYGRSTITIPWRNIRYFALVDSSTFRQLPTSTHPPTFCQVLKAGILSPGTPAPEHEAFEISDGENIICWLKATPFRHHRLFRFGEVALSDEDYAAFTQQLASLLMEKTNLPLYDLRLATQKPREK
ncbi:MAG TPA: hypothetical protein VFV38_25735 [Ktedonobacteraceae bacterium]|nr:hypothetical protein [Ktedonobacteraceae bacterium]